MAEEGLNESERYLTKLGKNAFLNPWSHPNVFINKGGAKELADLVVVFGKTVIIFSDKLCEIKPTATDEISWGRWHRSAIEKSVKQLIGARRIIEGGRFEFFTDASFSTKLEGGIPKDADIVLVGVAKRRLRVDVPGSELESRPLTLTDAPFRKSSSTPFEIGMDYGDEPFVHIFDEHSLDALLKEKDTLTDFVSYLKAKERCFRAHKLTRTTDQDLMAHHFRNYTENDTEIFEDIITAPAPLAIPAADWDAVRNHLNYLSMKSANGVSYAWDAAINYFHETLSEGPLRNRHIEMIMEMARETRFTRRTLSNRMHRGNDRIRRNRVDRRVTTTRNGEILYVFVVYNMDNWRSTSNLHNRKMDLDTTVRIALSLTDEGKAARRVIGLAYDTSPDTNYDFMMLDHGDVTPQDIEYARQAQKDHGIWTDVHRRQVAVDLYPPLEGIIDCCNCGSFYVCTDHFKSSTVQRTNPLQPPNRKARRAMMSRKR